MDNNTTQNPPARLSRFYAGGVQAHRHEVVHGHPDHAEGHHHVMTTDASTTARLRRLLTHAAKGPLTAEYRREAAYMLELLG